MMSELKSRYDIGWFSAYDTLKGMVILYGPDKVQEALNEIIANLQPKITIHGAPSPEMAHMIDLALKHFTGGAQVWVCDNCKSDYDTEQTMCISCGKRKPTHKPRISL